VCDVCGAALLQRADDNEETVRNRIEVYRRQTAPLVGYYRERGVLGEARGGGKAPHEVFEQVAEILGGA
jgi:adenylate kinase